MKRIVKSMQGNRHLVSRYNGPAYIDYDDSSHGYAEELAEEIGDNLSMLCDVADAFSASAYRAFRDFNDELRYMERYSADDVIGIVYGGMMSELEDSADSLYHSLMSSFDF